MDFDGVYTDPTDEGIACFQHFRDKIANLKLKAVGLESSQQVDSWLGEARARSASRPFHFGWRSEGRVSAFMFEDPFIRNIGLADFLDHLVEIGDKKARFVLGHLIKEEKIQSYGELSEWSFHQLKLKKKPDPQTKAWVEDAINKGHEVYIVSNSSTEKIEEFLNQNSYSLTTRPKVRGGAKKFGLGTSAKPLVIAKDKNYGDVKVDTDRPMYEQALLEIRPDAIIGDVFCLDLALPIRLQREGKLDLKWGLFYRHRDYTPSQMVDLVSGRESKVPEVKVIRDWSQVKS